MQVYGSNSIERWIALKGRAIKSYNGSSAIAAGVLRARHSASVITYKLLRLHPQESLGMCFVVLEPKQLYGQDLQVTQPTKTQPIAQALCNVF